MQCSCPFLCHFIYTSSIQKQKKKSMDSYYWISIPSLYSVIIHYTTGIIYHIGTKLNIIFNKIKFWSLLQRVKFSYFVGHVIKIEYQLHDYSLILFNQYLNLRWLTGEYDYVCIDCFLFIFKFSCFKSIKIYHNWE